MEDILRKLLTLNFSTKYSSFSSKFARFFFPITEVPSESKAIMQSFLINLKQIIVFIGNFLWHCKETHHKLKNEFSNINFQNNLENTVKYLRFFKFYQEKCIYGARKMLKFLRNGFISNSLIHFKILNILDSPHLPPINPFDALKKDQHSSWFIS